MVTATFVRSTENNHIIAFTISGHADYAKRGKDIVCAAVSAISVGTVNSVEQLLNVKLPTSMRNGWLQSSIPFQSDRAINEQVQLLLESMRVMLQTIEASYKQYVTVIEQFS